jgi:hypothetical protein
MAWVSAFNPVTLFRALPRTTVPEAVFKKLLREIVK